MLNTLRKTTLHGAYKTRRELVSNMNARTDHNIRVKITALSLSDGVSMNASISFS